jgi:hypothetical protein
LQKFLFTQQLSHINPTETKASTRIRRGIVSIAKFPEYFTEKLTNQTGNQ